VIRRAVAGAGVPGGHAYERSGARHVDQRCIQRIEFTAGAARAAAPGVVQDVGAVRHDVFQRRNALSGIEAAVVRNAVVEDPVAHQPGSGRDAADRLGEAQVICFYLVSGRNAGSVIAVRRS